MSLRPLCKSFSEGNFLEPASDLHHEKADNTQCCSHKKTFHKGCTRSQYIHHHCNGFEESPFFHPHMNNHSPQFEVVCNNQNRCRYHEQCLYTAGYHKFHLQCNCHSLRFILVFRSLRHHEESSWSTASCCRFVLCTMSLFCLAFSNASWNCAVQLN